MAADSAPLASDAALVICGHGSHLNPDSSAPVYDHAARIREQGVFTEVREAFWKEEPSLRNALRTVTATNVVVVPLFVSEGYFSDGVIPRELRLGDEALDVDKRVWYTDPVGTHHSMPDVIVKRAERITEDPDIGSRTGLAVIGHGTERNPKSAAAIRDHAETLDGRQRFAEVEALFMDQEPFVENVLEHFDSESIVAVPLFVADGFHTREEIPELLGLAGEYPDFENPSDVGDRRIWYAGAVGTEPSFASVITGRANDALSRNPDVDGSKRPASAERTGNESSERERAQAAFLDRVGDGSEWGELLIGTDNAGEETTYELRHRADEGVGPDRLETHTDPEDAREIARFDAEGEYRPLKSAPTLAQGWRLAGLGGSALFLAISYFYPASIENWHRERTGALDVTHYRETAERQTGIYAPVADLADDALDWAARACCTDATCLKRRTWEAGDGAGGPGRAIDAPAGDGRIPCREPCSFFIAAAREFVLANRVDGETPETPTLTESDREDLDSILTGIAENGAVSNVRDGEASEPTNRYRARYLREKLRALGAERPADGPAIPQEGGD